MDKQALLIRLVEGDPSTKLLGGLCLSKTAAISSGLSGLFKAIAASRHPELFVANHIQKLKLRRAPIDALIEQAKTSLKMMDSAPAGNAVAGGFDFDMFSSANPRKKILDTIKYLKRDNAAVADRIMDAIDRKEALAGRYQRFAKHKLNAAKPRIEQDLLGLVLPATAVAGAYGIKKATDK